MSDRARGWRRALIVGALAVVVVALAGMRVAQTPQQVCLSVFPAREVGGRAVALRATLVGISADGRRASVSLSDGCNAAECTVQRSFYGWAAPEGGFFTLMGCPDLR